MFKTNDVIRGGAERITCFKTDGVIHGDTERITCFKANGVIRGDAEIITYTHFFILRMGAGVRDAFPPPMCV